MFGGGEEEMAGLDQLPIGRVAGGVEEVDSSEAVSFGIPGLLKDGLSVIVHNEVFRLLVEQERL